ncbi:hypothetical protein B0T26DRAFT_711965 [Lasiosphaeria miniovina]|uniref:Diaminohydroxyphosphoribosylamino-pyrimidine deaminase n=1 Tax=Lasiosphaeria miniovina TaxID=1954250 RepID=A0AA40ALN6_9PEZI|nr:uncharacterized protein B0T26DRAFT_711965 [Lasiosphaeria miniovina]KAK0718127.1 hypothetical protein B0T26DRAFT_711965 [Lasiosphaeria miniovina]
MKLDALLQLLGEEISTPDEETFDLFSQQLPSQSLGFVDPKSTTLELTVAGRDLTIHQSPGVLSSNRAGGTTGAVVWKITPLLAEWISNSSNILFSHGILSPRSLVLELGCGISGLVGLLLAPRIARYVLTDQPYVARFVEQNIAENYHHSQTRSQGRQQQQQQQKRPKGGQNKQKQKQQAAKLTSTPVRESSGGDGSGGLIHFTPLDWETDEVTRALTGAAAAAAAAVNDTAAAASFDAVVACDCIYNLPLIEPFVATCADACRLRDAEAEDGEAENSHNSPPTVCIVAQQLRDPIVFEAWLASFVKPFRAWRVPDAMLPDSLRSHSGFVVHVGVLREEA